MQTIFKYTKLKVIAGYILFFILSIIAVVFVYRQINSLSVSEPASTNAGLKMHIISKTLTELYEAESLSNAFLQKSSVGIFEKYIRTMDRVYLNIDSLRNLTSSLEQISRLDSLDLLLEEKMDNLKELVKTKRSLASEKFYDKAISVMEANRDSIQKNSGLPPQVTTTTDSSYITNKKRKGFWGWLTGKQRVDTMLQIKISQQITVDTAKTQLLLHNPDSVVNILKTIREDAQQKTQGITQAITLREQELTAQSAHITGQLRRILGEYEQEEVSSSLYKIKQREQIVGTTTQVIAWIAAGALILIVLFCYFILRDLSKSQRYRKELEAAKKYADELLRSREKLMLTVTHDIKSPLGSIMGYIELLANTPTDGRQQYFLKNMKGSSEHILNLVTNLLDFSKLESNKVVIEEVVYNPLRLLTEIKDSFIPLAKDKHLELNCKIDRSLDCSSKGDILRIRQILVNLISNAIKYTDKGSISLVATTSTTDKEIILKIQDTGYGMSKEEQELIFKEFTRLSSASQVEGTGLGLTITLKLIQLLNGKISLESTKGKGSCFTVLLPLKRTAENPEAQKKQNLPLPAPVLGSGKIKILLVDDDPLQLEMTSGLLQNNGFETECTTLPDSVLEKLPTKPYDLVFSDIQMPGIDGFELIRRIRQLAVPFAKTIPVIALSANMEKKESDYLEAGFSAYLSKPFTGEQLLRIIAKVTGKDIQAAKPASSLPEEADTYERENYTLKNIMLFADNDKTVTDNILRSFITETNRHLKLLENSLSMEQWPEIINLAHKMLPTFRQLETKEIIITLEQIERAKDSTVNDKELAERSQKVIGDIRELIAKIRATEKLQD